MGMQKTAAPQPIDETRKFFADFLVALPPEIDEVHFIDRDNEMADAQKVRDECVTP